MIPRTFPSVLEGNTRKMVVYILPSIVGLQAWKDYIPVKGISVTNTAVENTYANNGYQVVKTLGGTTGTQAWVDYIPVYEDATLTKPWSTDIGGYIPASGLSSLNLDFTLGRLDPRITFSRTSNATLTGSNGLVQYAPHNLLTYSEQFDNAAWGKGLVTITANAAVAPDGTTTADKFVSAGGSFPQITQAATVPAGSNITFSVWVLSDGTSQIQQSILIDGARTDFTPTTVWTRVSVTKTATAGGSKSAVIATNSGTASASSFYIWGAQLEIGSTATTYNPTTVKNLLGYTEHFDNAAWTKSNATITSGFTDIYGQPFAQKLVEDSANSTHLVLQTTNPRPLSNPTISVYAKPAGRNWLFLNVFPSTPNDFANDTRAYFDLANGVLGTVTRGTATITPVGDGWYRCSLTASQFASTASANATSAIHVASANGTASYTGDGTSGIYIFGAQLSDSASLDPYVYNPVAAPAAAAYYGPRFDYDPVTLAPKGLLIEEQRTNLLTYSEQFDNAAWGKTAATVTANAAVSPDGTVNADKFSEDATTSVHRVLQSSTLVSGTAYTTSVYAKSGERTRFVLCFTDGVSTYGRGFDLSAQTSFAPTSGEVAPTTSSIVSIGNGWYRLSITATSASTSGNMQLRLLASGTNTNYPGVSGYGIFIWGAQLEAGAFATSYIPTVASQVTRAADNASMQGTNFSQWFNSNNGTLFVNYSAVASGIRTIFAINDGTANESIRLRTDSTNPLFTVTDNGVDQSNIDAGTVASNIYYKFAGAYAVNDFEASISGGAAVVDTSGTLPTVNRAMIGNSSAGNYLNGWLKTFAYYPRALSGTELQSLTA